jgi:hypothetical protein
MAEPGSRMLVKGNPPSDTDVALWIGKEAHEYWKRVSRLIEENYPNVFTPEWLFGGKKHGWSLRYKKSKPLCTFIPEKDRFSLLLVFGAEERKKVESVRDRLSKATLGGYDAATVYHDGKWVLLAIDSDAVIDDVRLLLSLKRKPKAERRK